MINSQGVAAKPPRVLFISHETTLTGAPIQLLHFVRALQAMDWNPVVAAPEAGPISDLLVSAGVEVVLDHTLLTDPDSTRLRALSRDFAVVVANTIASWPAVRAAHAEAVPVIWYLHETL